MQLIRLGTTVVNMENVVVIHVGVDTAELVTTAPDYTFEHDSDRPAPTPHIITLRGEQATALRWWIRANTEDLVAKHEGFINEATA